MSEENRIRFAGLMEEYLNIPSFVCELIEKQLEDNKYKEVIEYVVQRRNEIENKKDYLSEQEKIKRYLDLQQKVEQQEKEIDRLNKEYERIYNENCKLRENHNINDITLLDENERLNNIIDNIFKFMQNKYDNSDLTGFTISFMELQDLKALKENNK